MARTMLDWINANIRARESGVLTYEEWCDIRHNGTPDEITAAVEKMEAAGGYENLAR